MSSRISKFQLDVLVSRTFDVLFSDLTNLGLLLLQSPIIALCIVTVWKDVNEATDNLYFVMELAAIWFGAINASREIVKERSIFLRELRTGLETGSYVAAKFIVLSTLGFVQCLMLTAIVGRTIALEGGPFLHFIVLCAASLAGTALGLAISAFVSESDRAVALVPIVLLPQILFSDFAVDSKAAGKVASFCRNFTFTKWSYKADLEITAAEVSAGPIVSSIGILLLMTLVLLMAAAIILELRGYKER